MDRLLLFVFAPLGFLTVSLLAFYKYFLRVPKRTVPPDPNAVVSPADGTIWQIFFLDDRQQGEEIEIRKRFVGKIKALAGDVKDAASVVSIFMSPLDAHVNWSPIDGVVERIRHTPGKFFYAKSWQSLENEKNEILMRGKNLQVKVIQIAGFLARRIDCWTAEGKSPAKGELIGIIRLGSQVSLILPKQVSLRVKTGQKVKGGETVIGMIENSGP